MKKTPIMLAAILVGFAMNSASAHADDQKDIQALNTKLQSAFRKKDASAIEKLSTPDYTEKLPNGTTMTRAQITQQMKMQFSMTKAVNKMETRLSKVVVKGKMATAKSSYIYVGEIVDPEGHMGPKGKSHKISVSGVGSSVLVKTPKGWLFKSMTSDKESMMMDGKPLSMQGGPPKRKK